MAQHYPIEDWNLYSSIYESICRRFSKGLSGLKTSTKFEENSLQDFKLNPDDRVFNTWRRIRGEDEIFEVHYDSKEKKLLQVYLVK